MAQMIIEKISDLHPHGKLVLRPVEATWSNYPERLFSMKLGQILRCNAGI